MESFDVTSLYTIIDNIATRCFIKLSQANRKSINLYNLKICDIEQLLNACLSCNFFKFNNTYYRQNRGLAMDNRLAPILAIAYMDYTENHTFLNAVILYKKYIDDIIVIAKSKETLNSIYDSLNAIDPRIKFTREATEDGWLHFLDVKININNGLQSKWYRKPMKKDIIVHATSAHSIITKSNIIKAMISKVESVPSDSYRRLSFDHTARIARTTRHCYTKPGDKGRHKNW